jgi:sulfite reductase (NADPH) hemoprotein beta-component
MMKKPKSPAAQAVTGNAAETGRVVFRAADGTWVTDVNDAEIALTSEDGEALLAAAMRDQEANVVVDPYMVEVARVDGIWRPTRLRELIRTTGPTTGSSRILPAARPAA